MDLAGFVRGAFSVFVFCLVLIMIPWTRRPTEECKVFLLEGAAFFLGSFWLVVTLIKKRPLFKGKVFLWPLLAFFALNVLSAACSSYPEHSIAEVSRLFCLILIYFTASQLYTKPQYVLRLMLVVCLAVSLSSIYAICQKFGFDPFPWETKQLSTEVYKGLPGTLGNPNVAGHTLILAVVMCVALVIEKRTRWCALLLALFLGHLWYTNHRASFLALSMAVVLLVAVMIVRTRAHKPLSSVLAVSAMLFAVCFVGILGALGWTKLQSETRVPLDSSLLLRYNSYNSAAKMIVERPLLGYGPGNYTIENPRFWTDFEQRWFAQEYKMNAHVHNEMLESAIDSGVLAMGLYLWVLVSGIFYALLHFFARPSGQHRRLALMFASLFLAFLVDGFFGFNFHSPVSGVFLFIMAGAFEALYAPAEELGEERKFNLFGAYCFRGAVLVCALLSFIHSSQLFASELMYQTGTTAIHWKSYDFAERILKRGESLAPSNWFFAYERGKIATYQEQYEEAGEHFERSLSHNPNWIPTLVAGSGASANVYTREEGEGISIIGPKRRAAAKASAEYARHALELCGQLPGAEGTLARLAFFQSMFLEREGHSGPALADMRAGLLDKAIQHQSRAASYSGERQGERLSRLVHLNFLRGNYEAAEDALHRTIYLKPDFEQTWALLIGVAIDSGAMNELKSIMQNQLDYFSQRPVPDPGIIGMLHYRLAHIYDVLKDYSAAESAYKRAVAMRDQDELILIDFAHYARRQSVLENFGRFLLVTRSRLEANEKPVNPTMSILTLVLSEETPELTEAAQILGAMSKDIRSSEASKEEFVRATSVADFLAVEVFNAPHSTEHLFIAYLNVARAYALLNEEKRAAQVLEAGKGLPQTQQEKAGYLDFYAKLLFQQKRYADAERILREFYSVSLKNPVLSQMLAEALAANGKEAEAVVEYLRILSMVGSDKSKQDQIRSRIAELKK